MAWPYDARYFEAASGLYLPSALVNEMQDAIGKLYADHYCAPVEFHPELDGDNLPSWKQVYDEEEKGLVCRSAYKNLYAVVDLRDGGIVSAVNLKVYLTDVGMNISVLHCDRNFDSSGSAPSKATTVSLQSITLDSYPGWKTHTISGLSLAAGSNRQIVLRFGSANVGDYVAGVRVTMRPLTR
jgi:hypothetical protein